MKEVAMQITGPEFLFWVAVAIVSTVSASRITRLLVFDSFPPVMWLRGRWDRLTRHGDWSTLFHCQYCMGVWAAGFVVGWGYLVEFDQWWWLFNGFMSVGYGAAILMSNDGDESEGE